ncbi:MAG: VWA domain-containing protein [Candidatus Ancillula sp.]|jgi:Ca-activated chloride channel family protein|nr:VWA domain-containing protein [Candidatus Ancillula sp.]
MVSANITLAWPLALAIFGLIVFFVLAFKYINTKYKLNNLHIIDRRKSYFILSDVVRDPNGKLDKELESVEKSFRRLTRLRIVFFAIAITSVALLCARPANIKPVSEQLSTRDVVLCLDVSGSVLKYDKEILLAYNSIINSLNGERIALSIFNSTTRTVFPLTNDYSLIKRSMDEAISALSSVDQESNTANTPESDMHELLYFLAGTSSKTEYSSLIGDGLMNCNTTFDNADENRSRAVVFATDNILSGTPVYSLSESAEYSFENHIKLYTIYAGQTSLQGQENESQLKNVTQNNGGDYYFTPKGSKSVPNIIDSILTTEQKELNPDNKTIIEDRPELPLYILVGVFGIYLVICWRLKQ